jgi:tetratricopeptide (TPR) repeat protein
MTVWCRQCGAESSLDETYVTEVSVLGRARRYCPRCSRERNERNSRRIVPILGGLVLLAFLLLSLGGSRTGSAAASAGWAIANLCLFLVFLEIATLPHELGHALAAHLLGLRVFSITCGVGPRVYERTVAGVRLRINAYPFGGFTLSTPRDPRLWRLKSFLVVAAGPAVNGILLVVVLVFVTDLRIESILEGLRPGLAFLGASLFLLILNLVPMTVESAAGLNLNDGLSLLRIPFLKPSDRVEALSARYVLEALSCRERALLPEARSWAERGIDACPDSPSLHLDLGLTLALLGECEKARREFVFVAELPGVPPAVQAIARNNLAWANVVTGPNDRLEEADRVSQEALMTLGWMPALKGTRGAVLVELGRIEEGLVLLREALRDGRDEDLHPMARATYSGALALGLLAQGRHEEAQAWLVAARGHYPSCPLLPRVEAALAAGGNPVRGG